MKLRKSNGRQKGFTLIEIMVVLAIMGVLVGVVFPAVTGATIIGRTTAQSHDIKAAQDGIDRFNTGDLDGKPWPTQASLPGVTDIWVAGELPTGTGLMGEGTQANPYIFTQDDIAGIDWLSPASTAYGDMVFHSGCIRNKPRHADETIPMDAGSTTDVIVIQRETGEVYVKLQNVHTASVDFPVWALDKTGTAWVFVENGSY